MILVYYNLLLYSQIISIVEVATNQPIYQKKIEKLKTYYLPSTVYSCPCDRNKWNEYTTMTLKIIQWTFDCEF